MVFQGPKRSGRSRHGRPVFAMKTTAFRKRRLDNSAGRPGRSRSGGSRCLRRTQSAAASSCRCITMVDHETIFLSIPPRQPIPLLRDFPATQLRVGRVCGHALITPCRARALSMCKTLPRYQSSGKRGWTGQRGVSVYERWLRTKPSTPTWCAPSTASTRFWCSPDRRRRQTLALALHPLLTGDLKLGLTLAADDAERAVDDLDLTVALV